ncbi:unnamed protein product [Diatraea saccharalis]|uniref:Uncharacterized protein n=1 Tax=Diatraea saccharalis TaxID=40085 RepID=A0A9N9WAY8_9NEOP|nr:unnamed protein product [Diatraea saccharalis]
MDRAGTSAPVAERHPLVLGGRVPRSYGSLFPYYKFVRDTVSERNPFNEDARHLIRNALRIPASPCAGSTGDVGLLLWPHPQKGARQETEVYPLKLSDVPLMVGEARDRPGGHTPRSSPPFRPALKGQVPLGLGARRADRGVQLVDGSHPLSSRRGYGPTEVPAPHQSSCKHSRTPTAPQPRGEGNSPPHLTVGHLPGSSHLKAASLSPLALLHLTWREERDKRPRDRSGLCTLLCSPPR